MPILSDWTNQLLPRPKYLKVLTGDCRARVAEIREALPSSKSTTGTYQISISPGGTILRANDEPGFFYAQQTLQQIDTIFPKKRPCLEIRDWPDFSVRGFYHDISRGKVPTLATLLELAETCARYKINQLQLYIEHTYAFKNHPEVWQGADPLTAEEILALDARCAELHIDLVPSLSTFGHFYTWIHRKFPALNELERDVSGDAFCWWDRMMHYTLDCRNPESLELVCEMIRELRPLFRSRFFNICADETFDLGTGRNRAEADRLGKGRLYVDFLKAIMSEVREVGAIPLFWGDVIGSYPELLDEIPQDAIALDWDYAYPLGQTKAHLMAESGRTFYVCPGISGWNNWLPDFRVARRNITHFARLGRKLGAAGLLNTDWGDFGHIHTLGASLPGLVLGACAGWNPASIKPNETNAAISLRLFGDESGQLIGLLEEAAAARKASWQVVCFAHEPRSTSIPDNWFDARTGMPDGIFKYPAKVHERALKRIRELRKSALPHIRRIPFQLLREEILVGFLGLETMEEYYLVCQGRAGKAPLPQARREQCAEHLQQLSKALEKVWLQRNKHSEFFRILAVLESAGTFVRTA